MWPLLGCRLHFKMHLNVYSRKSVLMNFFFLLLLWMLRPPLPPSLLLIIGKHLPFSIFHSASKKKWICLGTFPLACNQGCLLDLVAIHMRGTQLKSFRCSSRQACAIGLRLSGCLSAPCRPVLWTDCLISTVWMNIFSLLPELTWDSSVLSAHWWHQHLEHRNTFASLVDSLVQRVTQLPLVYSLSTRGELATLGLHLCLFGSGNCVPFHVHFTLSLYWLPSVQILTVIAYQICNSLNSQPLKDSHCFSIIEVGTDPLTWPISHPSRGVLFAVHGCYFH